MAKIHKCGGQLLGQLSGALYFSWTFLVPTRCRSLAHFS